MDNPVAANLVFGEADGARLLDNLVHFARLLRKVGVNATPDKIQTAAQALTLVGFASRRDVFWTLAATFVENESALPVFRQAFLLFWRAAKADLPAAGGDAPGAPRRQETVTRRLAEALSLTEKRQVTAQVKWEGALSASELAAVCEQDFEQMADAEWRAAAACVRTLKPALPPVISRRRRAAARGACDLRASIRRAFKTGGEVTAFCHSRRRRRSPTLVILADISASMSAYARMFAHFIAALSAAPECRTHAFLFGTTLTPLRRRKNHDIDAAVAACAAATTDWNGGTRIGESLAAFNRLWNRRVLSDGAIVLLATDGLEHGDCRLLQREAERLARSCRHLIWLNPLLRYDRYQPLARGARLLHRAADDTRSIHNVRALAELAQVLSSPCHPLSSLR